MEVTTVAACLIGSYVAVSTFFYYFPQFLHKKNVKYKKFDPITVLSHRGGLAEQLENTLEAFEHSFKIGVDMVELDCHLTKDGHVVICHDNHLERSTGFNLNISDLNLEELPELVDCPPLFLMNTREISKEQKTTRNDSVKSKIPLLEDVFKKFPEFPINLDIKVDNDELIKKVNDLIIKYNREHITVWGSFSQSVLKKCHKVNENISSYFSLKGCINLLLLNLTGLLPFVKFKESHFEIIMPNYILKNRKDQLSWVFYIALWIVKICFMRKSFISHLRKRGILVYLWVLNTEEEFKYAIEHLEIDGIITDSPTKLIDFLKRNYVFKTKSRFPRNVVSSSSLYDN